MYNQSYEDYMRSVLGYSFGDSDTCNCVGDTYPNNPTPYATNQNMCQAPMPMSMPIPASTADVACTENIDEMYPDIYRIVNPMVCKICDENTKPVTKERMTEMVEIIYRTVEIDEKFEMKAKVELRNGDVRNPNAKTEVRETRQNNYLLRDLIWILLLNRLGGGRPPRPPFPGPGMPPPRPPRPPFPGPGGPGGHNPPPRPYPGGPGRPPRPEPRDYNEFVSF